ncbi:MAG: hypothetical protein ABSH06_14345 [Thermodesulfobacteriota bacterium]|jgi:hypothetical protein
MEKELTAIYDSDSKRFHRFLIDGGQEITGTIYIPKGKEIPERVIIQLKTKNEEVGRSG